MPLEPPTTSFEIIKVVNGTPTTLLDLGSPYPTESSILRLEVSSTTLKAYINGILRNQTTDSSFASGTPSIAVYNSGSAPTSRIELWSASNAAQTGGVGLVAAVGEKLHKLYYS